MLKIIVAYLKVRQARKEREELKRARKESWDRFFANGGEW